MHFIFNTRPFWEKARPKTLYFHLFSFPKDFPFAIRRTEGTSYTFSEKEKACWKEVSSGTSFVFLYYHETASHADEFFCCAVDLRRAASWTVLHHLKC